MTKEQIFGVVKENVLRVLLDVKPEQVLPETALSDLGANSVDRVEVVMYSMEELKIKVPSNELQGLSNLGGLVDVLWHHSAGKEGL
jgi:polyketide biosynthesis acyl carrier protein